MTCSWPALAKVKEGEPVIIVPDGILGLLPFEALVMKEGQGLDSLFVGDQLHPDLLPVGHGAGPAAAPAGTADRATLFALGNPVSPRNALPGYLRGETGKPWTAPAKRRSGPWPLPGRGKTTRASTDGKELRYPPLPETEGRSGPLPDLGVKPAPAGRALER